MGTYAGEGNIGVDVNAYCRWNANDDLAQGTIEGYFIVDALPASGEKGMIIGASSGSYPTINIYINSDGLITATHNNGSLWATYLYTPKIVLGKIYHIAYVWGTGGTQLWLNGSMIDSSTDTYSLSTSTSYWGLGRYFTISSSLEKCFDGKVDEFRVSNYRVTSFPSPAEGWREKLDNEGSISYILAYLDGNINCENSSPISVGPDSFNIIDYISGDETIVRSHSVFSLEPWGGRIQYDYTEGTTPFGGSGRDRFTDGCYEVYIKPDELPATGKMAPFMGSADPFSPNGLVDVDEASGFKVRAYHTTPTGISTILWSSTSIEVGKVYHVAYSWGAAGNQLWINGVLEDNDPSETREWLYGGPTAGWKDFGIMRAFGSSDSNRPTGLKGLYDNFRVSGYQKVAFPKPDSDLKSELRDEGLGKTHIIAHQENNSNDEAGNTPSTSNWGYTSTDPIVGSYSGYPTTSLGYCRWACAQINDGSMECYFRFSSLPSTSQYGFIMCMVDNTGDAIGFVRLCDDGKLEALHWDSVGSSTILYSRVLDIDVLYHICYTWGADGNKLYLNGKEEDSSTDTRGMKSTISYIGLGRAYTVVDSIGFAIDGEIDEFRVSEYQQLFQPLAINYDPNGFRLTGSISSIPLTHPTGHFPATWSFEGLTDGASLPPPTGFSTVISGISTVKIHGEQAGHKKVIKSEGLYPGDYGRVQYDNGSDRYGTGFEFWIYPDLNNEIELKMYDNLASLILQMEWYANGGANYDLRLWNGSSWTTIGSYGASSWLHIRIIFNWSGNAFDVYLDEVLQTSAFSFLNSASGWMYFQFRQTTGSSFNATFYLDAIGVTDDPGYSLGDNLTEERANGYVLRNTGEISFVPLEDSSGNRIRNVGEISIVPFENEGGIRVTGLPQLPYGEGIRALGNLTSIPDTPSQIRNIGDLAYIPFEDEGGIRAIGQLTGFPHDGGIRVTGKPLRKPFSWRVLFGFSALDHLTSTQEWYPSVIKDNGGDIGGNTSFWPAPVLVEYETIDTEDFPYNIFGGSSPLVPPSRLMTIKAYRIAKSWTSFDGEMGRSTGSSSQKGKVLTVRVESAHAITGDERLRVVYKFNAWSQAFFNANGNPPPVFFYMYLFRYRDTGSSYVIERRQLFFKSISLIFDNDEFFVWDDIINNAAQDWQVVSTHTTPMNIVGSHWITFDLTEVIGVTGLDLDFKIEIMDLRIWAESTFLGTPQVRNIGTVFKTNLAQIRNIGTVAQLNYWNQARVTGQLDFAPHEGGIRTTGTIQESYNNQIRNIGEITSIPFDNSGVGIRNIGSISYIPYPKPSLKAEYDFNHDPVGNLPSHSANWEHYPPNSPPSYIQEVRDGFGGRIKTLYIKDGIADYTSARAKWNFGLDGAYGIKHIIECDVATSVDSGYFAVAVWDLMNIHIAVLFSDDNKIYASTDGMTLHGGISYTDLQWVRLKVVFNDEYWDVYANDVLVAGNLAPYYSLLGVYHSMSFEFPSSPMLGLGSGEAYIDEINVSFPNYFGRIRNVGNAWDTFKEGVRNVGEIAVIPVKGQIRNIGEIPWSVKRDQVRNEGSVSGIPYSTGIRQVGEVTGSFLRNQIRTDGYISPTGDYHRRIRMTGWSGNRPRRPPFDLRMRIDFFRRRMRGRVKLYHFARDQGSFSHGYYQKEPVEEYDITDYCYFILSSEANVGYNVTGIDEGDIGAYLVIDSSKLPEGLPEINEGFDIVEYEGIKYRFDSHSNFHEEYYGLIEYKLTSMWHKRDHFLLYENQARMTGTVIGQLFNHQIRVRGEIEYGFRENIRVTGTISKQQFSHGIRVKGFLDNIQLKHSIRAIGEIFSNPYYHGIRVEGDLDYAHYINGIRATGYLIENLYELGIRNVGEVTSIPYYSGTRAIGFSDDEELLYDIIDEFMLREPSDQLVPNPIKAIDPDVKKWAGLFGSSGNPRDLDAKTIHEYKFRNKNKYFNKRWK